MVISPVRWLTFQRSTSVTRTYDCELAKVTHDENRGLSLLVLAGSEVVLEPLATCSVVNPAKVFLIVLRALIRLT